jgi:hypothetical protein
VRIPDVRVALASILALAGAGTSGPRAVTHLGATLRVPAAWHVSLAQTPGCDPRRLAVVSSAPIHVGARQTLPPPAAHEVLVVLLEDLLPADRPAGDLRRPAHFAWRPLRRIEGGCGLPASPAFMRYFKERGRYIGFIVYPGTQIRAPLRATTLAVMDSLRVATRP